ncbi:MAG: hypothetical protein ABSF53_08215 [Terracidiphilus sp.]|jgi:hypothetical protein
MPALLPLLLLCGSVAAQERSVAATAGFQAESAQASYPYLPSPDAQRFDLLAASENYSAQSFSGTSDVDNPPQDPHQGAADVHLQPSSTETDRVPQTKRILGIVPNFRAISTDEKLPPQSIKDKFMDATQDSFDYSSIFLPMALAAYSQLTNATPEFGSGAPAYARYFWHAAVDQTSENYMVEFVVPVLTREDTRYYTLGRGGFMKRTAYALSRAVVTRSDSGREVFNLSEVVGAGASAGLSSLYYPTRQRSFGNTGKQWGLDVGIDSASFVVREFWPNINQWLFRQKKPSGTTSQ